MRSSPRTAPLAAAALLALLAACGGQTRSSDQVAAEPPVSVDRITDHPEAYVGARVTLTSDVGKVHGLRAFTLERELQLDLDPEVGRHFQGKPVLVASEIRRVAKEEDEPSR